MLHFINTEIPSTLAPLECMESALDLEFGCGLWEETLKLLWMPISGELTADALFYPSPSLIRELSKIKNGFIVKDGTRILVQKPGTEIKELTPDPASVIIRYPWDILHIHEELLSKITDDRISGAVDPAANIRGHLILGEGSEILPGVFIEGCTVIGKHCRLGPNCYLRGNTFIGDNCHIGQAVEIKNSILMHHTAAGHLTYLGDSIVCPDTNFGGGTIVSNFRHDGKNHRYMVNGELLDTGRRKFGAMIGAGVHTGIHTSIYPGRRISAGKSTLPGEIVRENLN